MCEISSHFSAICNLVYGIADTCKMKKNHVCLEKSLPQPLIWLFFHSRMVRTKWLQGQGVGRGLKWGCPLDRRNWKRGGRKWQDWKRHGGHPGHHQSSNWSKWQQRWDLGNSKGGASQQDQAHSGRKGPLQGVFEERLHEEAPEVPARDGGSLQDLPVQKSTKLLICKYLFLRLLCEIAQDCGWYDLHFQVCAVMMLKLQSISWPASWKMQTYVLSMQNALQSCPRYSVSSSYPWRASWLLKASSSLSLFWVFVGCSLC